LEAVIMIRWFWRFRAAALAGVLILIADPSHAAGASGDALVGGGEGRPALLPTGQFVTPLAAPGSSYTALHTGLRPDDSADASGAMTTALSPDGKTLLVLTSGYNAYFYTPSGAKITTPLLDPKTGKPSSRVTNAFQWVFVFDVSRGVPRQLQQIQIPRHPLDGLVWDPSGSRFYVSGGEDDRIYIYKASGNVATPYVIDAPLPVLGHNPGDDTATPTYEGGILFHTRAGSSALVRSLGLNFSAMTAGVNISADGKTLFAANLQNDSISIVDATTHEVRDVALFAPGSRTPFGEYPIWVQPYSPAVSGPWGKVYVTSVRDGQLVIVSRSGRIGSIALGGEPAKMLLTRDARELYIANPDLDEIEVVDTATDTLRRRISVHRPGYPYRGSSPNSLALNADGTVLYTTLAGENAVGVIDVATGRVLGRIPTGWYPSSVTVSADGTRLYVTNTKCNSGPSPTLKGYYLPPSYPNPTHIDQYVYNLEKAGLTTIPVPGTDTLAYLSALVDANDRFFASGRSPMMSYLHGRIKHVIYIMKENRTYDQVLGDLGEGNGDARLTEFPEPVSPNFHALALRFGDLDNWYMASDVSGDGWNWWAQGHANDYTELTVPPDYAGAPFDFEWDGTNRNLNLSLRVFGAPTQTGERMTTLADPSGSSTIQPGDKDVAATVGTDDEAPGQTGGYIWDTVIRAGLSVRHYGLYDDETFYVSPSNPYDIPIDRHAGEHHLIQGWPARDSLIGRTDLYYRGWDLNVPDEYRYEEWKREFDGYVRSGDLPSLEILTVMNDHFGDFATNVGGLRTPALEMASNDHSIGLIVDAVSHSKFWKDTAIFVSEDDSQDGPDHVDSHRSTAWVISPYSRPGVVHTIYAHPSMLRTIEDILGANYLGLNDANAPSMDDAFTTQPNLQPYDAIIPGILCKPPVHRDLVPQCYSPFARKTQPVAQLHDGAWWSAQTKGMSFDGPDKNDAAAFNALLWRGIMGDEPYPPLAGALE
jgi:YVTN family beta-propeller protein